MRQRSVQFEKKRLLAVLSVLTFGLTAFFAVVGLEFLVPTTFVLGFFVVVPLVALLGDALPIVESETDGVEVERESAADGAIDELRERYARAANSPTRSSNGDSNDCWRPRTPKRRRRESARSTGSERTPPRERNDERLVGVPIATATSVANRRHGPPARRSAVLPLASPRRRSGHESGWLRLRV